MLHIITGPMFSGKTTELQRVVHRHILAKKKAVIFRPEIDNRFQKKIVTHDKKECLESTVWVKYCPVSIGNNYPINKEDFEDFDVIGIDEFQFFGCSIVQTIEMCLSLGKHVIAAGLNRDYKGRNFQPAGELLALADKITMLSAVCTVCGEDAGYSARLSDDGQLIKVGAADDYTALCRRHFYLVKRLKK